MKVGDLVIYVGGIRASPWGTGIVKRFPMGHDGKPVNNLVMIWWSRHGLVLEQINNLEIINESW